MKKILFTVLSLILFSVVTFAQLRIETPEIIGPPDADEDQMPNVILDWTAVVNATGYHVLVSTDENFNVIEVDMETPLSGYENSYLLFNQTYYWKVRAIEGEDYSDWSDPRSFTTFTMLELDKPDDEETGEEAEIEFEWEDKLGGNKVSGFNAYQLQVDTSSAIFANPNPQTIWDIFIEEEGDYEYILNQVYYGQTMYWRMRAVHPNDTCEWTEVWSFTTDNQIELDKPGNGETKIGLSEFIEWDEFAGTVEYDYQVHNNPTFSGALNYFVDSTEVPAPQLRYGTTYYWHVRGKNTRDTTMWSEIWDFETAGEVELASPMDMEDSVSVNPILTWEQITGTNAYNIQYSVDQTFTETASFFIPADDETSSPSFNIGTALEKGTEYYWRVRACIQNDTSNFSEPWSFITIGEVGIEEYLRNEQISLFPNPASDVVTLSISVEKSGLTNYSLTDLKGQEIETGMINLMAGENFHKIALKGMAKGVYLLNLENEDQIISKKLIIK